MESTVDERRALLFALVLAACGAAEGAPPTETPAPAEEPRGEVSEVEAPQEGPAPVAENPEAAEESAHPDAPIQPCDEAADCGWNDSCGPTRCVSVEHADSAERACFAAVEPPGDCLCSMGRCTLKRTESPEPVAGCRQGSCSLDPSIGRCVTTRTGLAGSVEEGPYCTCDYQADACELEWREPIECETVNDCWVDDRTPPRPIRRPRRLRGREFRPCEDGEAPPECRGGRCAIATVVFSC